MTPRTYRVEFKPDLRPDAAGIDWRLYTYGDGHWCVGSGHSGTFRSEERAIAAGEAWVRTGRAPADQIPEILAESALADERCLAAVEELSRIREGLAA